MVGKQLIWNSTDSIAIHKPKALFDNGQEFQSFRLSGYFTLHLHVIRQLKVVIAIHICKHICGVFL